MARSRAVLVAVAAALVAAAAAGWWIAGGSGRPVAAVVVEVVDGDTVVVRLDGGGLQTVRILGVDTPETRHPDRPVQCFGPEATAFTRDRLLGRQVLLEADVETTDVYGRRLAYLRVGGEAFAETLLRLGYARFLVIAPNLAHARSLLRAESEARLAGRGLWGAC